MCNAAHGEAMLRIEKTEALTKTMLLRMFWMETTNLAIDRPYEIFAMIRKGQIATIPANVMGAQRTFIASQFAVAA